MEPILWEGDPPELRSPTLVCAFAGWNDAASAASTALEAVAASLDPEVTARIDPEDFYDFQVNRPTIRLVEGQTRQIDWPAGKSDLFAGRLENRRGAWLGAELSAGAVMICVALLAGYLCVNQHEACRPFVERCERVPIVACAYPRAAAELLGVRVCS